MMTTNRPCSLFGSGAKALPLAVLLGLVVGGCGTTAADTALDESAQSSNEGASWKASFVGHDTWRARLSGMMVDRSVVLECMIFVGDTSSVTCGAGVKAVIADDGTFSSTGARSLRGRIKRDQTLVLDGYRYEACYQTSYWFCETSASVASGAAVPEAVCLIAGTSFDAHGRPYPPGTSIPTPVTGPTWIECSQCNGRCID